jgi:hypothetical protein
LQNLEASCWAHATLFHCVPGAYSQELKQPGSEAEVKNERNCTSSFPVRLIHGRPMDSLTIYIYQIVVHKQVSRIPTPLIFMEVTLGVSTCQRDVRGICLVISRNRVKFINSVLFLSFLLGQWI